MTLPLGAQAATTVSATAEPIAYGDAGEVNVTVTPSDATGRVELRNGDTVVGEADLVDGAADIALAARSLEPGSHRHVGDVRRRRHAPAVDELRDGHRHEGHADGGRGRDARRSCR